MQRRQFLGAAAAALPASGVVAGVTPDDEPETRECDVCGEAKPASMVDRTTVKTIAPLEADICVICQLVQNHGHPDGVCAECGEDAPVGYYFEVEFPLGEAGLPGYLSGVLCGDCAGWKAHNIQNRGVDNDPEAHEKLMGFLDVEDEFWREREGRQ